MITPSVNSDEAGRGANKWQPITLKTLYPLPMKSVQLPQNPKMNILGEKEETDGKGEEINHSIGSPTHLYDNPHQFKLDTSSAEEEMRSVRPLKYRTVLRSHLFTKASVSVADGELIAKGVSFRRNIHLQKISDREEELCLNMSQDNALQCNSSGATQQIRTPKQSISFSIPPVIDSIGLCDDMTDIDRTAPPKSAREQLPASRTIRTAQFDQFSVAHSIDDGSYLSRLRNMVEKQPNKPVLSVNKRSSTSQKHVLQILYEERS